MGASTSLRRRIWCAGGASCTASSGLRTRTARGLAQTPPGTANAVTFHPTPNLPLNQNHGRMQTQADGFHRSATSSTRAEMKRSQGLQTKGHVLVTDCGFRSPLPCWVPSTRSANTSKTRKEKIRGSGRVSSQSRYAEAPGSGTLQLSKRKITGQRNMKRRVAAEVVPFLRWQSRTAVVRLRAGRVALRWWQMSE